MPLIEKSRGVAGTDAVDPSHRFESELGWVEVDLDTQGRLTRLGLRPQRLQPPSGAPSAAARRIERQIIEYLEGRRQRFEIPLAPQGTEFQHKVWQAMLQIPYGETRSYSEVARLIGSEKAVRAVGAASGRNPIWVVVPCHRVIGAGGTLTGYAGGLPVKKHLLALEFRVRDKPLPGFLQPTPPTLFS